MYEHMSFPLFTFGGSVSASAVSLISDVSISLPGGSPASTPMYSSLLARWPVSCLWKDHTGFEKPLPVD
jgi:hypothetical protein